MSLMNPDVDFYFRKAGKWKREVAHMRTVALGCGLSETLKWGCPCYVLGNANIVLVHTFNEYCAYLFFKGALMKDPAGILIQQTENVQAARQIRFADEAEILELEPTLKAYIRQAVEVEKAGLKMPMKKTEDFPVAEEFQEKLDSMPELKDAFEALTPGRQRAYLLHFSQPKTAKTRVSRVEKAIPDIMASKGLTD